ncbi:hypothetical protein B296_00021109 [Ensete ventricosum]|uniref:Uncharacterized protein n=1 Tax=Ensete ventricosum TaxID=4639 RepID=A0A426ZZ21_ENSVE|nr:hypothetical protein B296_00021109 [Ensete ventricosum]
MLDVQCSGGCSRVTLLASGLSAARVSSFAATGMRAAWYESCLESLLAADKFKAFETGVGFAPIVVVNLLSVRGERMHGSLGTGENSPLGD